MQATYDSLSKLPPPAQKACETNSVYIYDTRPPAVAPLDCAFTSHVPTATAFGQLIDATQRSQILQHHLPLPLYGLPSAASLESSYMVPMHAVPLAMQGLQEVNPDFKTLVAQANYDSLLQQCNFRNAMLLQQQQQLLQQQTQLQHQQEQQRQQRQQERHQQQQQQLLQNPQHHQKDQAQAEKDVVQQQPRTQFETLNSASSFNFGPNLQSYLRFWAAAIFEQKPPF
jgi:hypothetical protein